MFQNDKAPKALEIILKEFGGLCPAPTAADDSWGKVRRELRELMALISPENLEGETLPVLGVLGETGAHKRSLCLRLAKSLAPRPEFRGFSSDLAHGSTPILDAAIKYAAKDPKHPEFPVGLRILDDFSLVKILSGVRKTAPDYSGFTQKDVETARDRLATRPPGEKRRRRKKSGRDGAPGLPWPPGGMSELTAWFRENPINFAHKTLMDKYCWPLFPKTLILDSPEDRGEFLSFLWGNHPRLTELYKTALVFLSRLKGGTAFHAPASLLKERSPADFDLALAGVVPDDSEEIGLMDPDGEIIRVPLAILDLLVWEITLPCLSDDSENLLSKMNLLEYPGLDAPFKLKNVSSLEDPGIFKKAFLNEKSRFFFEESLALGKVQALMALLDAAKLRDGVENEVRPIVLGERESPKAPVSGVPADSEAAPAAAPERPAGEGPTRKRARAPKVTEPEAPPLPPEIAPISELPLSARFKPLYELPPHSKSALGEAANLFATRVLGREPEDRLGKLSRLGIVITNADVLLKEGRPDRETFCERLDQMLRPFSRFYHEQYATSLGDYPYTLPEPPVMWDMDTSKLPGNYFMPEDDPPDELRDQFRAGESVFNPFDLFGAGDSDSGFFDDDFAGEVPEGEIFSDPLSDVLPKIFPGSPPDSRLDFIDPESLPAGGDAAGNPGKPKEPGGRGTVARVTRVNGKIHLEIMDVDDIRDSAGPPDTAGDGANDAATEGAKDATDDRAGDGVPDPESVGEKHFPVTSVTAFGPDGFLRGSGEIDPEDPSDPEIDFRDEPGGKAVPRNPGPMEFENSLFFPPYHLSRHELKEPVFRAKNELVFVNPEYRGPAEKLLDDFARSAVVTEFFREPAKSMGALFLHPLSSVWRIEHKFMKAAEGHLKTRELLRRVYGQTLKIVERLRKDESTLDFKSSANFLSEKDPLFKILKALSVVHDCLNELDELDAVLPKTCVEPGMFFNRMRGLP
ncbi:MAG: putative virulence factor [Deltaproteobacteria bacterium]|jgi:hypothetical protein|nr:putative virulence factor [Deltaproteobacteria bacterium]